MLWPTTVWTLSEVRLSQKSTCPSWPPDTNTWLSCHVWTHITCPTCPPDLTCTTSPVSQSVRKIWSSPAPAETSVCPPGIQEQSRTVPSWMLRVLESRSPASGGPSLPSASLATLVIFTVLSLLPVASILPSGDQLGKWKLISNKTNRSIKKSVTKINCFLQGYETPRVLKAELKEIPRLWQS